MAVENFFLPDSEVAFHASWRNVKRVAFALYALDLARDVNPEGTADQDWLATVDPAPLRRVHELEKDTQDDGTHQPGQDTMGVGKKLEPGAYLLVATAGGVSAREIVLVTDSALALKTGGATSLAWFCDAVTGEPRTGAAFRVWQQYHDNGHNRWRPVKAEAGPDGLATFALPDGGGALVAFATDGARQAMAAGHAWYNRPGREPTWKIYAFTDRTAYRPGETVQWKILARAHDGSAYSTPANRVLKATVLDPRGATALETNLTLNAFGTAWAELAVTDKMPLGAYPVRFEADGRMVGQAQLFRLEEYKLPEFKVAVQVPEEQGRKKTFLLGDAVEAEVKAEYYSGGPVANATVEVVVRQQPHVRWWYPPCDFGWFYRDFAPQRHQWGGGQVVKQETIRTDAEGRARVKFDTQRSGQELQYTIEARVTDASRREIVGSGSVRVGNQRYFVHITPANRLRRPGQKASFDLRALDANDQPLAVTGRV